MTGIWRAMFVMLLPWALCGLLVAGWLGTRTSQKKAVVTSQDAKTTVVAEAPVRPVLDPTMVQIDVPGAGRIEVREERLGQDYTCGAWLVQLSGEHELFSTSAATEAGARAALHAAAVEIAVATEGK